VIAASSGARFLEARAVEALRAELIATGVIVTPNLAEAAELAGVPLGPLVGSVGPGVEFTDARLEAARILLACGARAVIVKGGHGAESPARDLVATSAGLVFWSTHARLAGGKVRGSGCRYASHLAARLALGTSLVDAVGDAARHVRAAIAAVHAGSGST
jgi:hydroxymethylpyrimidine/phosphomethylpyrimidine kinase